MIVAPQEDDAAEFVKLVQKTLDGIINRYSPQTLIVIKIDNWFGSKWLGFKGKVLGLLGTWSIPYNAPADRLVIPPFVPNRVVSQRRFVAPSFKETEPGTPIHKKIPSDLARIRKMSNEAPNTAIIWYSGNSRTAGRGAVMAYIPAQRSYWPWYASWTKSDRWKLVENWAIKREQLIELMAQTSAAGYHSPRLPGSAGGAAPLRGNRVGSPYSLTRTQAAP